MGANHLPSGIPLGTPGAILSSGLILVLNICVGLVVTCTMYAFYALFRKGGDSRMGGNLLSNYGEAIAMILFGIGFSNLLCRRT